ncbi:hypothetical protein [Catenulispora pinisilvae]|uniref:hypothetical protein n=1 Tax=Catenulispora pinisilvae TaxID=2705253 RepID=UPI001891A1D1|nr:hypothetical protein [Catenulispora pinisilvae]
MRRSAIGTLLLAGIVIISTSAGSGGCGSSPGGSSSSDGGGSTSGGSSGGAAPTNPGSRANIPSSAKFSSGASDAGGQSCTAALSLQKWDNDHPSHILTGGAQVICLEPPKSLTHTLYLEYQSGADPTNSWNTEGGDSFETQYSYNPDASFLVSASCRVGTWRLRYHAEGVDPNNLPILIDYTSPNTTIYITKCGGS